VIITWPLWGWDRCDGGGGEVPISTGTTLDHAVGGVAGRGSSAWRRRSRAAFRDRQASTLPLDSADSTEPALPAESTEATLRNEPRDRTEPADPMDRTEPEDPIDRIDPVEPIDKIDPDEPMLMIDPDERALRGKRSMAFVIGPL
jgi:hypothetical protein